VIFKKIFKGIVTKENKHFDRIAGSIQCPILVHLHYDICFSQTLIIFVPGYNICSGLHKIGSGHNNGFGHSNSTLKFFENYLLGINIPKLHF
jgi:hypothetical protein